jgi:hypothetical protein
MTTEPRRALAALALVPVAAGAFAGSVAWAADRGPASEPSDPPATAAPAVEVSPSPAGVDRQMAAVAEQLDALGARLAAVQAELDARSAQAATGATGVTSGSAPRAADPAPRAQPAPQAAPPVDTTTRASG